MNKKVEINIEELVLNGFAPGDRYNIGKAIEQELARLFTEQGVPSILSKNRNFERLDAGAFNATTDSKAESIGNQTAKSIYKGLKP